jgi:hypothetical protein
LKYQMPEFVGEPLDSFDRRELSTLADSMRVDPPKIRELIDWMDEKKISKLADADRDELIEKAREIGFSVYADTAEAIKRSGLRGPGES